jgi:hypothetical protein
MKKRAAEWPLRRCAVVQGHLTPYVSLVPIASNRVHAADKIATGSLPRVCTKDHRLRKRRTQSVADRRNRPAQLRFAHVKHRRPVTDLVDLLKGGARAIWPAAMIGAVDIALLGEIDPCEA